MKRHYIPVTADVPGVSEGTRSFLRRVIRTALAEQGVDFPCEVDVLVTGDAGIHTINLEMRGVDRPTDVLSFPEFELTPGELPGAEDADPGTGYVPLGDMVISLERCAAQAEEFGHLLDDLTALSERNVHILLNAHAQMRKFEQPDELGNYDRWEMKLTKKVAPMVKEWADMVLFANYQTYVVNVDGQGTAKGRNKVQGGKRVMKTAHHPCWDAKNRENLPEEMDFDFTQIANLFPGKPQLPHAHAEVPEMIPSAASIPEVSAPPPEQPAERMTEAPAGIPPALYALMRQDGVTEEEIMFAVAGKGYFPGDTPIRNYPPDFVQGVLIGAWPQVRGMVLANREEVPF